MPFFDYKCSKCGHVYEALIRSVARDKPKCPKCAEEGESQAKQVSAPKLFNGLPMGNGSFSKMNSKK